MTWDQKSSWISYAMEKPTRSFESDHESTLEYWNDLEQLLSCQLEYFIPSNILRTGYGKDCLDANIQRSLHRKDHEGAS